MFLDHENHLNGLNAPQSGKNFAHLAVMQKAMELLDMVQIFCDAMYSDDSDFTEDPDKMLWRHITQQMLEDGFSIPVKIAGTESTDIFSTKMEYAVFIKSAATRIYASSRAISNEGGDSESYLELIRNQVDEFKVEFISWIQGFDRQKDVPDDWGISFK
jgi:hypothetical protein